MSWFVLSLAALCGMGVQNFLYKVAAVHALRPRVVTFYFILLTAAVLWVVQLSQESIARFSSAALLLGMIDAVGFYVLTLTRLRALALIPVHLAFPLLRIGTAGTAFAGVAAFGDPLTPQLIGALVLMAAAAGLIGWERHEDKKQSVHYRAGVLLILLSAAASVTCQIVSKLAAEQTVLLNYMTAANTMIVVFALLETRASTGQGLHYPSRSELLAAAGLAASNLLGWYSYLCALREGPLSSASVIVSMAFVVPIGLSALVYRERLTPMRIAAILLMIAVVVLLKG